MDRLQLDRPVVLGHMAGAVLGHILCSRPELRLKGMVAVSAAGPMLTRRQYARMAPRQRAMAYTARYAPALLPFFVRAGVSLLQSDKSESFIDALYPAGTHERRVIDRFDLSDAMLRGYRSSAQARGHGVHSGRFADGSGLARGTGYQETPGNTSARGAGSGSCPRRSRGVCPTRRAY